MQPASPARPAIVAHCDCKKANEAFFGPLRSRGNDDEPYTMVPVTAKGDSCPHCGYHVVRQPATSLKAAHANRANSKRAANRVRPVIGRCVSTGKEVTFNTARDAYEAGYGAVSWAIKRGTELKGFVWTRA